MASGKHVNSPAFQSPKAPISESLSSTPVPDLWRVENRPATVTVLAPWQQPDTAAAPASVPAPQQWTVVSTPTHPDLTNKWLNVTKTKYCFQEITMNKTTMKIPVTMNWSWLQSSKFSLAKPGPSGYPPAASCSLVHQPLPLEDLFIFTQHSLVKYKVRKLTRTCLLYLHLGSIEIKLDNFRNRDVWVETVD